MKDLLYSVMLNDHDADGKVILRSITGGPDLHITEQELAKYFTGKGDQE